MTTALDADVYVAPIRVDEIFADPTYQRTLDVTRARKMAATWDRRLAGILEVSDRGDSHTPRYAIMDGQHRWAAAQFLVDPPLLVANVHEGLTVADEAALFDKLNRQRKQTSPWDHWRARRAAGDQMILAIETTADKAGLRITESVASDRALWCIGTLEKIALSAGGLDLLQATLELVTDAWGTSQRSAFEAPLIHGVAMAVDTFGDKIEAQRLIDALAEQPPKRIRMQATTMRDSGMPGSLAKLSAVAVVNVYNQKKAAGRLTWPHSWKGVLPKPIREKVTATAQRRGGAAKATTQHEAIPKLEQVTSEHSRPRTVPDAIPHYADTEEHTEAVARLEGKPVAEIAAAVGIPERTVRRIQADLGISEAS